VLCLTTFGKMAECLPGVLDCASPGADPATCADYNGMYTSQEGNVGLLVGAALIAAFMCFTIGAAA